MKASFTSSMFDTSGLVRLSILYGKDLAISSWWSILYIKLAVYGRTELVADMITDPKRAARTTTLDMPFIFFYFP